LIFDFLILSVEKITQNTPIAAGRDAAAAAAAAVVAIGCLCPTSPG
jgi:hypothetical protein